MKGRMEMAAEGLLLKPLLKSYLEQEKQPEFSVTFARKGQRAPDGWFHPSTHPLWTERQLYYYLTEPHNLRRRPLGDVGMMAVTVGTVLHSFLQAVVVDMGVVAPETVEMPVSDDATRARGAVDGILSINGVEAVWDFKTINPFAIKYVKDMDLDGWCERYPYYYAQQQEYMRMAGLPLAIVTMLATSSPWEQREIHIPYNPEFAEDTASKYRRVLDCVERGVLPVTECCVPGDRVSQTCDARECCPNGTGSLVSVPVSVVEK